MWQFSSSSMCSLADFEKCAYEQQPESKWSKLFQKRSQVDEHGWTEEAAVAFWELEESTSSVTPTDLQKEDVEIYKDVISQELSKRFEDIVKESLKDPRLLTAFAEYLDKHTLIIFLNYVFNQNKLPELFLQGVYVKLLPSILNIKDAKIITEILLKSLSMNEDKFTTVLLPIMIKNGISESVILEFIGKISDSDKCKLMHKFCRIKLGENKFEKYLRLIIELYGIVDKCFTVQSYILENLSETNEDCANNKLYGRLLLMYLESVNVKYIDFMTLQELVINHYTSYRRSCEVVLSKLQKDLVAFQKSLNYIC